MNYDELTVTLSNREQLFINNPVYSRISKNSPLTELLKLKFLIFQLLAFTCAAMILIKDRKYLTPTTVILIVFLSVFVIVTVMFVLASVMLLLAALDVSK